MTLEGTGGKLKERVLKKVRFLPSGS